MGQAILSELQNLNRNLGDLIPDRAPEPAPVAVTEDWYTFVFDAVIPAGLQTIATQLNDATGHFDLVFITAISTVTDRALPSFNFRIREGEQGKFLTANGDFLDWRNGTGTAERPYYVKGRRRFRANSTLIVEFADLSGQDNTVQFAMHGIKVSI
jgi:hypothetical protein